MHIIIVEDDEKVAKLFQYTLESSGHKISNFQNPIKALEFIENNDFDAVFTDWTMPVVNGDQIATTVKKQKPGAFVALISGIAEQITNTAIFDEVIKKPVRIAVLKELAQRAQTIISSR